MNAYDKFANTPIEFLKGVGPKRAELLNKELAVFRYKDLLQEYPFRYIDKTAFQTVSSIHPDSGYIQLKGILTSLSVLGAGRKQRLVGRLKDASGSIELIWFRSVSWLRDSLHTGHEYICYGKVSFFNSKANIAHPEMDPVIAGKQNLNLELVPVYSSTEKLSKFSLEGKARRKLSKLLLEQLKNISVPDWLPLSLREKYRFPDKKKSWLDIHFPKVQTDLDRARYRLKFEELFFLQLRLLRLKNKRSVSFKGPSFLEVGAYFNQFYKNNLPFELTNAQKRVLKEIRNNVGKGKHMNRLLQGDVGSGKTIVGLMSMLIAIDNGFQACLLAPTEILAQQHFVSLKKYCEGLGLNLDFLSGSIKGKKRKALFEALAQGEINILIGTHAILEDPVQFHNLGLAIIDEQHRFGVAQRAKLWKKGKDLVPHVLIMSATPIPRTLAMTLYGDLEVSVIDELPPGRKSIQTTAMKETQRLRLFGLIKEEIAKGRQVYVVYPLIEASAKLDLLNLDEGYQGLRKVFPPPEYQISVVHGRMKSEDKEHEMQRFVKGQTQIMIATTVIEVGVDVPNATMMVIEHTERFGLSQLHQLRGRVGRGGDQSYCILMSGYKLSNESRKRISVMCSTNDGFKIAEEDLMLRGMGNLEGKQQSGQMNLNIANLSQDKRVLEAARHEAIKILNEDPQLLKTEHAGIRSYLQEEAKAMELWSRIS